MSTHNLRWMVLLGMVAGFGLGAGSPGIARADTEADGSAIQVLMQVKPLDPKNEKTKGDAPQIEVTAIGAPNTAVEKFSLYEDGAKQPVELKPLSKRDYNQGTEPLAIAIVLYGWEIWIGNDKVPPTAAFPADDSTRVGGVLDSLEQALDSVKFKDFGPPGSQGMVITYADKPAIRVKMGPLSAITGSALGTQSDYFGTKGAELVRAVELALSELNKTTARKVLIVLCDGNDTDNEHAKTALSSLKAQAQKNNVQVFGLIYRAANGYSGDTNVLTALVQPTKLLTGADTIGPAISDILSRMADRQYLTFPGYDKKLELGLPWDGKQHNLVLKIDKIVTEPAAVTLSPLWKASKGGFPWLVLVIVLVGVILLIVIGVKVFSSKPAPIPVPLAAPVMAVEAPKPMGPAKTVMIGVGGDDGGFPVVGWLVALNGPQAYQTLRLRSGGTKIGTAPPCDIVVNDGFMSTEHCQINASPQGYTLVDGGSTNGCYVNDRKIQGKLDLVDNDTVTLGKTNFKFKSIV
jgi:FHA domain